MGNAVVMRTAGANQLAVGHTRSRMSSSTPRKVEQPPPESPQLQILPYQPRALQLDCRTHWMEHPSARASVMLLKCCAGRPRRGGGAVGVQGSERADTGKFSKLCSPAMD